MASVWPFADLILLSQNGPYSPDKLNLEAVDEPSPVRATLRSEEYKSMIVGEAERIGVLKEAQSGCT